jgi:hypothetical protein
MQLLKERWRKLAPRSSHLWRFALATSSTLAKSERNLIRRLL